MSNISEDTQVGAYCQTFYQLCGSPMDVGLFLKLAIQCAAALADLHRRHIVHGNLNPHTISVEIKTGKVMFAGYSRAPCVLEEYPPMHLEETLAYISPEQTGRMNWAVDYRTDLYSLGVTFYEMITGVLPFQVSGVLESVYCHIACYPRPPSVVIPTIPPVISDIVMKLLSKAPEERYQTALGLKFDLERCLAQWETRRYIEPFVLGEEDIPDTLLVPQKLYGREKDIDALVGTFERVVEHGTPEMIMVAGYSGIGKTSLVRELYRPVVGRHGFFISGKFDQYKRNIPYSTIVEAFQELVRQILTESEERIARWKEQIQGALGINGQLILDVIPQVELIIGKQPPVPDLPPTEAQNRFNMVFRQFLGVFTKKENPLVLFLDDMQWTDPASLTLLEHIITYPDTRYLLLVGAYRDNEVSPSHPLILKLDNICKSGAILHTITLTPLSLEDLAHLMADTFSSDRSQVEPLTRLVYEKTGGNPFFTIQFLKILYDEGLVEFDRIERRWKWDIARIQAKGYTDNIVDLMIGKLRKLSGGTLQEIELASCIGNKFDLHTLAVISNIPDEKTRQALDEAVLEGPVIHLTEDSYQFLHDRVRETAYSLIPEARRAELHLQIGRMLLTNTPEDRMAESVFDIVNHLNHGATLITDQREKDRLAELNLLAGRKAMATAAYLSAIGYLSSGQALLASDSWETRYDLTFGLYIVRARCEWLASRFDVATDLLAVLVPNGKKRADLTEAYKIEVGLHTTQGDNERAVLTALMACSKLFGMKFPLHPSREELQRTAKRVWQELEERPIEDLIRLPAMTDLEMRRGVELLSTSLPSAYHVDTYLHDMMCCEIVSLSMRYGNTNGSPHGYVTFGATLGQAFEMWEEAYRFGKLANDLVDKPGFEGGKASTYFTIGLFIDHWVQHVRNVIPWFYKAFQSAITYGDMNVACYASNAIVGFRLIRGDPLAEIVAEAEKQLDFTRRAKYYATYGDILSVYDIAQNLRGKTPSLSRYGMQDFDQAKFENHLMYSIRPLNPGIYYIYKTAAQFLYGNYEEAVAASIKARELTGTRWHQDECYYWTALALAAHYGYATPEKRKEYLETLAAYQKQFEVWQKHCPENFLNKYALISAEIARIEGRDLDAERFYEEAARSAHENGFVHNEGISCELASRFYRARGLDTIADAYLRRARSCYVRWGADRIVTQLDQKYPWLLEEERAAAARGMGAGIRGVDAITVAKASQAISGEIDLSRLLETLMRIAMENAGAQKGCLVMARDGKLSINAMAMLEGSAIKVKVLTAMPIDSAVLPMRIINYVNRTHEKVILADATTDPMFSPDEYLVRIKPRSVLCMPIVRHAELVGMLYLENSLVSGAFTPDKLAILELISTQAAISLENATLYTELRGQQERLKSIIDNTTAVIYLKDIGSRYILINRRFADLFHVNAEMIRGKTDQDIFPGAMASQFYSNDRKVMETGKPMEFEETLPQEDGLHTYISLKFPLYDISGRVYAVCGISTDITERKKFENAVNKARVQAELYLDLMGHDIINMNQAIMGYLEITKDMLELGKVDKELIDKPIDIIKHASKLIDNVKKLEQVQEGRVPLEDVDLCNVLSQVVEEFSRGVPGRTITINYEACSGYIVKASRMLKDVFDNIVDNAVRHSTGPITIYIGVSRITEEGRTFFRTAIADTGPGIPDGSKKNIFLIQPGYMGKASRRGLGLYFVRTLVESFHGRVWVEDRVPGDSRKGSKFLVQLPAAPKPTS